MPKKSVAARREQVLDFVSPDIRDILFYEVVDHRLPKHKVPPNPGDAHWDKKNYPNHVFLTRTNHAEKGWVRNWYAAKREDQDDYNYEFSYPYAGLKFCPRITRTYVELRSDYSDEGPLDKGSPDPADPLLDDVLPEDQTPFMGAKLIDESTKRVGDNTFDSLFVVVQRQYDKVPTEDQQDIYNAEIQYPYNGRSEYPRYIRTYVVPRQEYSPIPSATEDRVYAGAVIVSQKRDRFEDPKLDSLYVLVTRVFDTIPNIGNASELDIFKTFGYRILRPHGTKETNRIIWRFPISYSNYAEGGDLSACPIPGYTTLKLVDEDAQPQDDDQTLIVVREFDEFPGDDLDSVSQRIVAGVPEGFLVSSIITETANREENGTGPDSVSGNPTNPGGAIIESSVVPENGNILRIWKNSVLVQLTIGNRVGEELDPMTGAMLPWTQELVAKGTSGSAVDASGNWSEVAPYNQLFSIQTTRKASSLAGSSRTYNTIEDFYWPPVLEAILFSAVSKYVEPGGGDTFLSEYRLDWKIKDAYSGPCKATVTESWHQTAPIQETPVQMHPEAIYWNFILSKGSIPATLHPAFTIFEVIGNNHPNYPSTTASKAIPATNYTDWPASIVKRISIIPYHRGGGFIKRKVTVLKPGT